MTVKRFTIHVHPKSRADRVEPTGDATLEVWTRAPAAEGQANAAVARLLADWLRVPLSSVRLAVGARSRTKIFDVMAG